ncbi:MAG: 50S ribosomal protein L11 methyltransferase [Desulfobacteraceae bacterium]|nr:MAG: 50S ribosomal protein L11 methyltransferase [Desulfobacteraceae bacterium]
MQWVEISLMLPEAAHEAVSGFLFDTGCEGLVTEGPLLKAYIPASADLDSIGQRILIFLREMRRIFPEIGPAEPSFTPVEAGDWSKKWRSFFHAEKVTPELCVTPPWESPCSEWEGEVILMDPGPAFGTGGHATTRMCLRAMERVTLAPGWTMLDVGTGSGILAIYGAKRGAERIVAADIDPEALRWAERNIDLNGLSGRIELTERAVQNLDERFSLITANLTMDVIVELLPIFGTLLNPGGWLVLSGLLRDQAEKVRSTMKGKGLPMGKAYYRGEWASIITKKKTGQVTRDR